MMGRVWTDAKDMCGIPQRTKPRDFTHSDVAYVKRYLEQELKIYDEPIH